MATASASPAEPVALRHIAALLVANAALALGPWLVRLADTGPVAAGFWRLLLPLPLMLLLARRELLVAVPQARIGRGTALLVAAAGAFFALDLASWHLGIERTRLGNAALFGNAGSVILMAWGLIAARRAPRALELVAIVAALSGAGLLMGGSFRISTENLAGDALCLLAGILYVGYILTLQPLRGRFGGWTLLAGCAMAGAPVLLLIALLLGEPVWPGDWTPIAALAVSSQMVGQGLLIWCLRFFPPLVIGLALLTQPALAALTGWLAFGESLSGGDVAGMVLVGSALVLARLREGRKT